MIEVPFRLGASVLVWLLAAGASVTASDWPQFLGPTRNGLYAGGDLAQTWPKEGPSIVWRLAIGQGFSGPVEQGGKLILFHRLGDREMVDCLEAGAGKRLWRADYPTAYRDPIAGEDHGPRATPAIAHGKVYTLGAEGRLHCLDLANGKTVWQRDMRADLGASEGFFGFACSPLIAGRAVLLNVGGRGGAGIIALDKDSGKMLWRATDDEASYSSPVLATFGLQQLALFFTRAGLVGLTPDKGTIQFRFPWRSRMEASVNAAAPVVVGDLIFITACYETGAALLRLRSGKLERVWSGDDILSSHFATSLYRDGHLYGFDGRQEYGPRLRCIELATGKVCWTQEGLGAGSLLLAKDRLLVLLESGLLLQVAADPAAYHELARAQILGAHSRALPALADGFLYARSRTQLICVDLRQR